MDQLPFSKLWKYGAISGILIGLICLLPIIGGWDDYVNQYQIDNRSSSTYYKFYPITRIFASLFFWVIAGTLMCWLTSRFAAGKQSKKLSRKVILFFIGGFLTALAIQFAARDALIFNRMLIAQGKGGPLGEPSFETIGNFFAAGFIYVGIYILILRSHKTESFFKTNYLSTLTLAVMSYGLVFLLWYSISNGDPIPTDTPYIFDWSFPHSERIFLLPLMISILFIVYYLGIKKINSKEFDVAISYSYENVYFTNDLHQRLKENGLSVYKDDHYNYESVGHSLNAYLYRVFRYRSKYGLIIVSKNYLTSKYASEELAILKERSLVEKNIILPVFLDDTKLIDLGLPESLAYLDARKLGIDKIAAIIAMRVMPPKA